jgi:plastocyanin domain-containing protein
MKDKTVTFLLIILVVGLGWFFIGNSSTSGGNSTNGNSASTNVQKVTIGIKNGNYYPNTITVKVGQPVRIYLDSTVSGCYRTFTIKDFGIVRTLPTPNDYIEFTPTKKGTFRFACIMGMGTGTLIVE